MDRAAERIAELTERLDELQLLNDLLIATVQQKQHFLTAMGHRLRTPLTTVVGFGEMLAAGEVADAADQRMVYGDIVAAGQQMLDLVNDILELSRLDAGNLRLRREALDLAAILDEAREMLEPLAAGRRQRLAVAVAADVPRAFADASWTVQIVVKLGMNALRFTPTGGTITLQARYADAAHVAIRVADTGVGIPPEEQETIFEPFHQSTSGARQEQGTGLELALVKRLVEIEGGTITLRSTRGIGTTFTVTLPRADSLPDGATDT